MTCGEWLAMKLADEFAVWTQQQQHGVGAARPSGDRPEVTTRRIAGFDTADVIGTARLPAVKTHRIAGFNSWGA
ncbi:MAG: hypothetical protein BroJett003_11180 [Planctomycetota bacterium]|nr:MAG: hypothetical protein BroJett003_11180 [Planctomycetota bacterium]